jgi:arylsulfatase A-like enzyme
VASVWAASLRAGLVAPDSRWILAPLVAAFALPVPTPALATSPPNIVFILLDDVGYGDLGAYGGTFVATPNLDRLAAEGMRFTDYHSNGAVCTPARAAILTGRYPISLGLGRNLGRNIGRGSQRGLSPRVETIADRLRAVGYATGHFGKWHLGSQPEQLPTRHGFDRSAITVKSNGRYVDPWVSIDGAPPFRHQGHRTEFTTDQVLGFIEAHADGPFFVNVWYHAAHRPYQPPPHWAARYPDSDSGRYAALLSHADEEIGRILASLTRLGLDSRTLVLVASDNGGVAKDIPTNGPLRGHKRDLFEGGLRVPLIARWSGTIAAGSENPSLFLGIDFLPTLIGLAGGRASEDLPGENMESALLAGEVIQRPRPVFWAGPEGIGPASDPTSDLYRYAVRVGRWKLVRQLTGEGPSPMLFDLGLDPGETTDVAAQYPDLVEELELSHRKWRLSESRLGAPVADTSGAASMRPPWLRLAGGGIALDVDSRAAAHDGDLSFAVRIIPASLRGEQVVAEHEGSWRLALSEVGTLLLSVQGADGTAVQIESGGRLQPGVAADVAFSFFGGPPRSHAELRLFVDAQLEGRSRDVAALAIPGSALRIGNSAGGGQPFRGWLWNPSLHLVSLQAAELADLDQDGIRNADDSCIGAADASQRDSDADGIGDACDPDLDGDGIVGTADRALFYRVVWSREGEARYDPRSDFDGDGTVGPSDLVALLRALGAPPGPSGRVCTPAEPCIAP